MPFVNGRYYSSRGQYSPYVSIQIQRYKSAQANQKFTQLASAASDTFATANANLITGMGDITAKVASKRIQNERAAKAAAAKAVNALV